MGRRRERYCKWQRNLTEPSAAGPRRVQAAIHQVAVWYAENRKSGCNLISGVALKAIA